MPRSRNIKPGFFLNDSLGSLSPIHRLMFIGLWTLCDREGRVLDRPMQIKASVLPYDACNPSRMLQDLHESGFILRYEKQGVKAIQVINFLKHQNPHVKEQQSTILAPDLPDTQHQTSTIQARLIPDSLNPITETKPRKVLGKQKGNGADVDLPDWLPLDHWQTFLTMRQRIRKPATPRAQRMLIAKLDMLRNQGHNPAQLLAESELKCWSSIYEPKP